MPQLAKGGKFVYGWVVVGEQMRVKLPPQSASDYGFTAGEELLLTPGSLRSGGFGVGKQSRLFLSRIQSRCTQRIYLDEDLIIELPESCSARPGQRLLAVRGSGLALVFIERGPIFDVAMQHGEIEVFA